MAVQNTGKKISQLPTNNTTSSTDVIAVEGADGRVRQEFIPTSSGSGNTQNEVERVTVADIGQPATAELGFDFNSGLFYAADVDGNWHVLPRTSPHFPSTFTILSGDPSGTALLPGTFHEAGVDPATGIFYYVDANGVWQPQTSPSGTQIDDLVEVTSSDIGQPANDGEQFGIDPANGDRFYVDANGVWQLAATATSTAPNGVRYLEFPIDNNHFATIEGDDVAGATVAFSNSTWTVNIPANKHVTGVTIKGVAADNDSNDQLRVEVIGGKGNIGIGQIRVPIFQKTDLSPELFGDPSETNPLPVDVDNNPQLKVVGVGTPGASSIIARYDGNNAFSAYGITIFVV